MSSPIVSTKQGVLKGKVCTDYDGNTYLGFLGIPYAKPPLGDLRFKAPQPPEPWEGIRDATQDGNACYAFDALLQTLQGSEDCLFLNVFTKEIKSSKNNLKPVMVWIHGGGFTSGSNNSNFYGPEFLICEDVVIVTINYRLGTLGFLSLNDPQLGIPGNAGLKDMVMALKWVKNNIEEFNGNPDNVTIFGESAGGAAVHYLMLSPMAKGLFHKAIALSGCATNLWASGKSGAGEIAEALGFKDANEKAILNFLQKVTKEELIEAQRKDTDLLLADKKRSLGPVVETCVPNEECFLQDEPSNIIASGNYNKVPLMMGFTSREGMVYDFMEKIYQTSFKFTDFEKAIPYTLNLQKGSPQSLEVANKIKNFYFGEKDPLSKEAEDDYYKLQTDNMFFREIYSSALSHLKTSETPIYLYRFSIETNLNAVKKICQIDKQGVCHGDDLGYLFKTLFTSKFKPESLEHITMKRFVRYITNFATNGNPNPPVRDELFPIIWEPLTKDSITFLDVNENLTLGCNPEEQRMKFWDAIFKLQQKNLIDF